MPDPRPLALVTGASSGIGTELARQLAARGFDCAITARREDRLEALETELVADHGVHVEVIGHDLSTPDSAEGLIEKVAVLDRPLDILVNNAGFGVYGRMVELDLPKTKAMVELNAVSVTTLTQHYAAEMVRRGSGRILQVSSVGAFQPSPLYAVYSATKSYVLSFSAALAWELKGTGVSVTTLCPGLTSTEFHEVADHLKPKSMDFATMTAAAVAAYGLKATFKGKAVATPGFLNRLNAFFVKLMPRSWSTAVAGKMMQQRRK